MTTKGSALRVLLVDDEPLARLRLRQLLAQCAEPAATVVGEASHSREALDLLSTQPCDALLLDIRMPGTDGLQFAQRLATVLPAPAVVFVTAHEEHARAAFDLEAVDYLTKPVRLERLQQALRRVRQQREIAVPVAGAAMPSADSGALLITERQRTLRIPLREIVIARAGQKLVTLVTTTREHVVDESLGDIEQRLGPDFIRVHRNAIVARSAVRELQLRASHDGGEGGWAVRVVPPGVWVPVSRRMLPVVREMLAGA